MSTENIQESGSGFHVEKSVTIPAAGEKRKWPIRYKLIMIIMSVSLIAVFLTGFSSTVYQLLKFRDRMIDNLSIHAQILADNCSAALAFNDAEDAGRIMESLRIHQTIVNASIRRNDGTVFAEYNRKGFDQPPRPFPDDGFFRMDNQWVVVTKKIVINEQTIGSVFIQSDLSEMKAFVFQSAAEMGVTVILVILVAYFLSFRFQKIISDPIQHLTEIAGEITLNETYAGRAVKQGEDEIGKLTETFNNMLDRIELREIALRESEERFRQLVETMNEGMGVVNGTGHFTYVNPGLTTMLGYSSEEMIGQVPQRFVDDSEKIKMYQDFIRQKQGYFTKYEVEWKRKDGSNVPTIISPHRIIDGNGTYIGSMAVVTDITEIRRAENEIHILNEELEKRVIERTRQLEEAVKELEGFSYSVSHDLRAPLRHIQGFSTMLKKRLGDNLDEKGKHYVNVIVSSTDKMSRLIDDLLKFSRMSRAELMTSEINMNQLVQDAVSELSPLTKNRNIEWEIGRLPDIQGDPGLLGQVFINLISNALKFTKTRETAVVHIDAHKDTDSNPVYWVRDNGVGFSMAYQDKLFGVFQRLHTEEEFEGTGIGLALVSRIINRHKGRIWAEGEVDQGATFYFSLPGNH